LLIQPIRAIADVVDMKEVHSFETALDGARFGNAECMGWIWRRHQPVLLGWLHGMDGGLADDIASEAWVEAHRAMRNFQGDEANFRSWLFTIARRRLIDAQRRKKRAEDLNTASIETSDHGVEQTTLDGIAAGDAIAFVRTHLSPEQAEVVLLRVVAGLDTDEVAAVTGKKPGAIRVIQHRALRKLAQVLAAGHSTDAPLDTAGL
jgi:RNA polymerase sigma-70 factor (ECF subfamily)